MAIIKKRKPIKIGGSKAVTFPSSWTTLDREVTIALNRIGIVIPEGMPIEEIKEDIEKILEELKRIRKV